MCPRRRRLCYKVQITIKSYDRLLVPVSAAWTGDKATREERMEGGDWWLSFQSLGPHRDLETSGEVYECLIVLYNKWILIISL